MAAPRGSESAPLIIGSCNSHMGPLLKSQLREYCPASHLEQFDAFADAYDERSTLFDLQMQHPNLDLPGHYDPGMRLADMDHDGVATKVIYHFSQNGQPFPFTMSPVGSLVGSRTAGE